MNNPIIIAHVFVTHNPKIHILDSFCTTYKKYIYELFCYEMQSKTLGIVLLYGKCCLFLLLLASLQ